MRLPQRLLAFFLSFALIFSSTSVFAASPVGWSASPADIIMNGATATINAVKGSGSSALQSTIKHAPAAGRLAKHIVKVGGVFAVGMAISQIIGDGVDYVLDPANNRVKYKVPAPDNTQYLWQEYNGSRLFVTPSEACKARRIDERLVWTGNYQGSGSSLRCLVYFKNNPSDVFPDHWITRVPNPAYDASKPDEEKYIPYSQVAQKIISNAAAGNAPSQEFVKTVAIEDLESGALDVPLNTAAVPKTDNPPITDPNNPPVTDPNAPPVPFDPSSIIAAIKSVMAAVVNMAGVLGAKIDALMVEMGLQNAETNRVINDGMADVVAANNATGARVGDVVAAIEALEGNTLDGQVINDAVDRAIAAGHTDTASIVAAIEAIEGNTLDGQVINDAVDRVIANDNVNAEAAKAADAANTAAVTDAIGAQTDAITQTDPETGDLSLRFPVFCGWAGLVCDAAQVVIDAPAAIKDFFKEPDSSDTDLDIPDVPLPEPNTDISFGGSCPADLSVNFNLYGTSTDFVLMPFSKFCPLLSTFVKPTLIVLGSFFAVSIVGGRRDE